MDSSAYSLTVPDGSADKAVAVQVFGYIEDIGVAATEALRVLKSGGKLVIGDLHPDSLIWLSDAPVRMARMISSWDNHFVAGDVPARLPAPMKNAGHVVKEVR